MKRRISGFPVSPGSIEALVRCGGKIKYILIAYSLDNIYAKNCCDRTVYDIASDYSKSKVGRFLRHSVQDESKRKLDNLVSHRKRPLKWR